MDCEASQKMMFWCAGMKSCLCHCCIFLETTLSRKWCLIAEVLGHWPCLQPPMQSSQGWLDSQWTPQPVLSSHYDLPTTMAKKYCSKSSLHSHRDVSPLAGDFQLGGDWGGTKQMGIFHTGKCCCASSQERSSIAPRLWKFVLSLLLLFPAVDFLAKYCIFSPEKLVEYKRAFQAVSKKDFRRLQRFSQQHYVQHVLQSHLTSTCFFQSNRIEKLALLNTPYRSVNSKVFVV